MPFTAGLAAGRLNRSIEIQSRTMEQDETGGPIESWKTIYACRAAIDIQNSALIYSTAKFISKVIYKITIRYSPRVAVSAKQRVVHTDPLGIVHTYTIESVINDKAANTQLTLFCYELDGTA